MKKEIHNKIFTNTFMNGKHKVYVTHTFDGNDKRSEAANLILGNKNYKYKNEED